MNFLKLIRWKNLLFIIYIMLLMRYCIIEKILQAYGLPLLFDDWKYALLIFMTILIAASGYMINEYFDVDIDRVNQRHNLIAKGTFSKSFTFYTHLIFNLLAIIIGFYLSYDIGLWKMGFIYFLIAGLLWFYSSSYKYQFLVGNIIIAFLAAFVVFLPAIYEIPLQISYNADYIITNKIDVNIATKWLIGFSVFAFLLTLMREIIKDIQDIEGDKQNQAKTLPIVLGLKGSKFIVFILSLFVIGLITWTYLKFFNDKISLIYIIIAIILPFVYFILKLLKAKNNKDFKHLSAVLKIIMFLGVSFSFIACYNFYKIIS